VAARELLPPEQQRMLDEQLIGRGIRSEKLLEAMALVERARFVPENLQAAAYADRALPIACDQTISQPYIVALMTDALELSGGERVLEIGTGSGYQTAVLAQLAAWVVTVERHAELSQQAARRLHEQGYRKVTFIVGDGTLGWPELAPYDRIVVTAAGPQVPEALFEQLAEGGIVVAPIGPAESQDLLQIRKLGGLPVVRSLGGCRFVPLVSQAEAQPQ
jgi:protein-L-isoaspartate(D-aspartate) O-methyltransferase